MPRRRSRINSTLLVLPLPSDNQCSALTIFVRYVLPCICQAGIYANPCPSCYWIVGAAMPINSKSRLMYCSCFLSVVCACSKVTINYYCTVNVLYCSYSTVVSRLYHLPSDVTYANKVLYWLYFTSTYCRSCLDIWCPLLSYMCSLYIYGKQRHVEGKGCL